jgi:hypothetical protein
VRSLRTLAITSLFATTFTAISAISATASANPRPLPFTYIYETIGEGESEIEQYVDYTPMRGLSSETKDKAWFGATQFQTEYEYGLTSRLELGLYATFVPSAPADLTNTGHLSEGNGLKQRLRYRFSELRELPVDIAIYGEVVENSREIELEAKLILQRWIGSSVRVAANLSVEHEYYFDGHGEWVLNPSVGVSWQAHPSIQPGFEYWMRAEYNPGEAGPRPFSDGPHHYLGPVLMLNFGRIWWSSGVYLRVDDTAHTMDVGEPYSRIWVRSVFGVSL